MSIWIAIIITGLINYLTRLGSVLLIKPQKLNNTLKTVLNYVPSAVFAAIITVLRSTCVIIGTQWRVPF